VLLEAQKKKLGEQLEVYTTQNKAGLCILSRFVGTSTTCDRNSFNRLELTNQCLIIKKKENKNVKSLVHTIHF